jgi:hypothetical protein
MALISANVTQYSIKLPAQANNQSRYEAIVYLTTSAGTAFLYFYPNGSALPDNRIRIQHGRPTYYVYYHNNYLAEVISDLRNERPISFSFDDESRYSTIRTGSESVGEGEEVIDVDEWLQNHPVVCNALVWETSSGIQRYTDWSSNRKRQLQHAVELALINRSLGLTDPPPNAANPADDASATTVLAEDHAWPLFKTYVAKSLAVEIGRFVPWSILGYSDEELALLLDSREMFQWSSRYDGYQIDGNQGRVIPAPPEHTSAFLISSGLIANRRVDTIGNVLNWCRENMVHFSGRATTANLEDQWQYRGYPPVSRVIAGTPFTGHPEYGVRHRTAGCRGTTGFLRAVLRVVNIPVAATHACGHAMPHFVNENMYLTHGDDPYNAFAKATPPYPARELLIPQSTFDAWLGSGASEDERCNNIGRRVYELALTYLPDRLLHTRCTDIATGLPRSESGVLDAFDRYYTLAELEEVDLWERLDSKIEDFGGCEHVP